jgi:hypothetical protein
MPTINGKACVVDGKPVDKVYSNGAKIYGRNLLTGTSNTQDYTISRNGWVNFSQSSNGMSTSISGTPGASYTYSAIVKSATFGFSPKIQFYDINKKPIKTITDPNKPDTGLRYVTGIAPADTAFIIACMILNNPTDSQTVVFNSEKLEQNATASPWSPAPEDVM